MGVVVRAAREGAGISLRLLASQAGVNHSHLSRFETGERPISRVMYEHLLAAIAELLHREAA